jgi:small subunit ribosomal protein S5
MSSINTFISPLYRCLAAQSLGAIELQALRCAPISFRITELCSLARLQLQQPVAGLSTSRSVLASSGSESDGAEEGIQLPKGRHLPRVSSSILAKRAQLDGSELTAEARQRRQQILDLLRSGTPGGSDTKTAAAASTYLDSFFGDEYMGEEAAAALAASGPPGPAGNAIDTLAESPFDGDTSSVAVPISVPSPVSATEEMDLLSSLRGLGHGARRVVLQRLLQGGMLKADPAAAAEWAEIQKAFEPPQGFRLKVVDVNRTCKGTRSGGLYRYGCMVVVGNGEGVLGWGQGKAAEVAPAVKKAYARACRNLYPVPRYNGHTIPERVEAKFGQCKVVMYPKAAGQGITANNAVYEICKMAGIYDIGVKVYGSRNPRNTSEII